MREYNPATLRWLERVCTRSRLVGRSKYAPHQGVEECRRRREQMCAGEYNQTN